MRITLGLLPSALLILTGCSALTQDECGMTGDWYAFQTAQTHRDQVRWQEEGRQFGMSLAFERPLSFSSDGVITGGRADGVSLGGGITATSWECQGPDRFTLTGDMLGMQKRVEVHPDGFWEFYGTGYATYYVKSNDGPVDAAENLLEFMEQRASQRGRTFSR